MAAKRKTKKAARVKAAKPAARVARAKTVKRSVAKSAGKKAARTGARARANANTPMFQKVAFTLFPVLDPARARAFYENVLGFTRGLAAPNGVWTEYDLPGGGCLALFCHPDPKYARSPGGASVAFEVADLDALNQRLVAAGVVYQGDMVHGPRCRMSNILDTEGNAIILHQLTHAK
jgi:predicted enzyme related to lactoylglutathione lyase